MILATLALGGAILGATTVAGLLMLYQIRATTDSQNSAKAIFAADSGVNWALYNYYCNLDDSCAAALDAQPTLSNGATLEPIICYDDTGVATTSCSDTTTAVFAITKGTSLNSERAFYVGFATATYP